MENQDKINTSDKNLKDAFQYFYRKTKKYYEKRDKAERLSYLDICDYISGRLNVNGDMVDLEWYRNERDLGGLSKFPTS